MKIAESVIAITGSGRGIGAEIAKQLAQQGAQLALIDRDATALAHTRDAIERHAGYCRTYPCDITHETEVEQTFTAIREDFGQLHALVNNAGILRDSLLVKVVDGVIAKKMSVADYDQVIAVHQRGAFLCTREAAIHMIETGVNDGCLIHISSIARHGNIGQSNYSAAKAAMVAQSHVWAKELGRYNIRSQVIAPGCIDTEMLRSMPSSVLNTMTTQVPLKRIGQVEHIAASVTHVLENDYLSGGVIDVNGGLTL